MPPYEVRITGRLEKATPDKKAKKWDPVPNRSEPWTREENFTYRLIALLEDAFNAGVQHGRENPDEPIRLIPAAELENVERLRAFGLHLRCESKAIVAAFGLPVETVEKYIG